VDGLGAAAAQRKAELRTRIPLLSGAAIPHGRRILVLRHALAGLVHHAEVVLRARLALVGRRAEPVQRLSPLVRHALALGVPPARALPAQPLALLGGAARPIGCPWKRGSLPGHGSRETENAAIELVTTTRKVVHRATKIELK